MQHHQDAAGYWSAWARTMAREEMAGDSAHDLSHLDRVWAMVRELMQSHPGADAVVVALACYLHNLVNLPKNDPRRARACRILGVDRFMSECRALTNLVGNATASVVVARWEGELDKEALDAALNGTAAAPSATAALSLGEARHAG